jgi:hypothetical protein
MTDALFRRVRLALLAVGPALALLPVAAIAQHERPRPDPEDRELGTAVEHRVRGQIMVDEGSSQRLLPGTWVILHRVGADSAGPVDSVRADAGGRFAFTYQRSPQDEAIFFLSGSHGGIAYFSSPLRTRDESGEGAVIVAFDTSSNVGILRTLGRHVVVGARRGDRREMLEAIEISNDTALTIVAAGDDRPSWATILPEGATDFTVGEGDVGDGGLVLNGGRVELYAPVAPGIKQVTFRYTLPAAAFPVSLPLTDTLAVLEVLIESRAGSAEGAGLREVDPTITGDRTFRRFLAENAPANSVLRIDVGDDRKGGNLVLPFLIAAAGILLAVLVMVLRRHAGDSDAGATLAGERSRT